MFSPEMAQLQILARLLRRRIKIKHNNPNQKQKSMKKVILSLAVVAMTTAASFAQAGAAPASGTPAPAPPIPVTPAAQENPNTPEILFTTEVLDYGTIDYNADGNREFKFKNTGKEPLIIQSATGSCGCTVPTPPKDPVKPGETGVIKVHYDTKRPGKFEKTITVVSNAKTSPKIIKIKGEVKPDANVQNNATPAVK